MTDDLPNTYRIREAWLEALADSPGVLCRHGSGGEMLTRICDSQRSVVKAIGHGGGRLGVAEDLMPTGECKVCSTGYEAFTAATPHTMLLRIASQ